MKTTLYQVGSTLYRLKGNNLVKAGKGSPGQMSLFGGDFDEGKHKRDSSGKFTSGGGTSGSGSGGLPVIGINAEPRPMSDEKKQEIKDWMKRQDDMIANPGIQYDEETDEPLQTDEEWYRENLDPEVVSLMDELAANPSGDDQSYDWNDWGDISAAAFLVMSKKVAAAMGVDESHDAVDNILEAHSMGEDW